MLAPMHKYKSLECYEGLRGPPRYLATRVFWEINTVGNSQTRKPWTQFKLESAHTARLGINEMNYRGKKKATPSYSAIVALTVRKSWRYIVGSAYLAGYRKPHDAGESEHVLIPG